MNAYRIPMHDASLLAGAEDDQRRKDAADRIADDYDAMTEVYTDAAAHLVEYGDMPDVLRALDRAEYRLTRLLTGDTSLADPDTLRLFREVVRQAGIVSGRVEATLDEHAEVEA